MSSSSVPVSPTTPTTPTSPHQPPFPIHKSSFVELNVREVLEKESVEEAKEVSKKVNLEIEKKKEELRMLVGERYRDLIDAADTIGTMRASSLSVFDKLTALREKFCSFPSKLVNIKVPLELLSNEKRLNSSELEIASELKLSLEIPRQVNICLDKKQIVAALHLVLFYEKYFCKNSKPYEWTFLATNSGQSEQEIYESIKTSVITACEDIFDNYGDEEIGRLAECLITKQILTKVSCHKIFVELLERRIKIIKSLLEDSNPEFTDNIILSLKAVYSIFIDPQLYNLASKKVRKLELLPSKYGYKLTTKSLDQFNRETLTIDEAPRATLLAELILKHFIQPLRQDLEECHEKQIFMNDADFKNFHGLHEFRTSIIKNLQESTETQDLMRMVLGTSKSLWTEAFLPVFSEKCRKVSKTWVKDIFNFLEQDAFPRFQKLDEQLDLVSFLWKPTSLNQNEKSKYDADTDLKLKLNCLSPNIANLCSELEDQFQELLKDFQFLGDASLKDHISSCLVQEIDEFVDKSLISSFTSKNLFVGKFCSALIELCTTLWKLLSQNDKSKLRQILQVKCETRWKAWSDQIISQFATNIQGKMPDLHPFTVASFMPVAEEFSPESETGEVVKASINVPLQLSHSLHTLLFGICVDLAKVGPQSIPKSVREHLRLNLGLEVEKLYRSLVTLSKAAAGDDTNKLVPQVSAQLMFDIKFCQWLHPRLSENEGIKSLIAELETEIDPFDMDIVIPRMKINLKRFIFETHLTIGLLYSEESHSFIAQNFKTKQTQSMQLVSPSLKTPLPLLPI